jgi:hypothetical protein
MRRPSSLLLSLPPSILLMSMLAGCAAAGPRVWIDVPTSGARLEPGQEVQVISHAYASSGVAEALMSVNGEPYSRGPVETSGESFGKVSQTWVADRPGEYALQVVAYDVSGAASAPAVVWVSVLSPLITPPVAAVSTPMAGATEEPTAAVPTQTITPFPPVTAELWADHTDLAAGECTTLRWQTTNASAVLLGTTSVDLQGSMPICPESSTSYRLTASGPSGQVERTVSLTVTAPQDVQGPSLSGLDNSPASIWDGASCGATTATITVTATDASGVSAVELHYRVVKAGEQGQWRVFSMSPADGNTYTAALGPSQLNSSLNLYGGGTVEYWVKATDSLRNTSQTGTATFSAELCFG